MYSKIICTGGPSYDIIRPIVPYIWRIGRGRHEHKHYTSIIIWPTLTVLSLPLCLEWNNGSYFTPNNRDRQLSKHVCIYISAVSDKCLLGVENRGFDARKSPSGVHGQNPGGDLGDYIPRSWSILTYMKHYLWSPYGIGQTIVFLPCGFFLLLLSSIFFPFLA